MESTTSRKLRGGYYTPPKMAAFLAKWAIRGATDIVLEPSCGDGAFLEASVDRYLSVDANKQDIAKQLYAVEFDSVEAAKAARLVRHLGIGSTSQRLHTGDFFSYCKTHLADKVQFDAIVGNPPFVRYQDFPEEQRQPAFALMFRAGLRPSRLTNTWIPFLVASVLLLKNGGRLGMVIPAELFQVNYAAETRRFLSSSFSTLLVVTFRQLVFPDVQQEVVLLLGEKNGKQRHGIKIVEVDNVDALSELDLSKLARQTVDLDHSTEKWTQYYLSDHEIETLRKIKADPSIPLSGEFIDVDVGIVTGQNQFFVVDKEQVDKYGLGKHVSRIIGKANQLKGIVVNDSDWERLAQANQPVYLLNIPNISLGNLPAGVRRYIDYGESMGYQSGYKCRIRKPWWTVPSAWIPDAFMLRQVHLCPKIVVNKCKATATDTLHRVRLINGMTCQAISCSFMNSLTLAFSEVTGRSYGGGVLTFEPSEAEKLPLPVKNASELNTAEIDSLVRTSQLDKVLDIADDVLLRKGLQLKDREISTLRNIWVKLRDRRTQRHASVT